MKRILDNLHVDLIAAASMVAMVATGYILRFPLPPGTNKSLSLWGLTRHQWGTVHFWISLFLMVLVVIHVCLHWQWIVVSVKRRLGNTTPSKSSMTSGLLTVFGITAVLTLFGWATGSSVRTITEPIEGVCQLEDGDNQLGSMKTDEPKQARVAFWKDVYPIFEKSCLSCHGPRKQFGGFRVDSKADFLEDNGKPPLVVPGQSKESPLITILSGERKNMASADVHHLGKEELAIVTEWIDGGAEWPVRSAD